jgi:hypothetical protein
MAMDMEEGWYGAKMTGSSVKVAFPGPRKTTQNYRYRYIGTYLYLCGLLQRFDLTAVQL